MKVWFITLCINNMHRLKQLYTENPEGQIHNLLKVCQSVKRNCLRNKHISEQKVLIIFDFFFGI